MKMIDTIWILWFFAGHMFIPLIFLLRCFFTIKHFRSISYMALSILNTVVSIHFVDTYLNDFFQASSTLTGYYLILCPVIFCLVIILSGLSEKSPSWIALFIIWIESVNLYVINGAYLHG